jgi:hypothetical protein
VGQEIIRRIYRPVVEHGMWRVRTDQELGELCKDLDIVADIKNKKSEQIGHLERTSRKNGHGKVIKKIFENKLEGRRRLEDLE